MIGRKNRREEVTGVVVGSKNNRRGRLLKHTNEFTQWSYQCDFCAKLNKRVNWRKILVRVSLHPAKVKQPTSPPLNLSNDNKIDLLTGKAIRPESYALSGRMWSFAEPLGSHSPCTALKTHYCIVAGYSYNNPFFPARGQNQKTHQNVQWFSKSSQKPHINSLRAVNSKLLLTLSFKVNRPANRVRNLTWFFHSKTGQLL